MERWSVMNSGFNFRGVVVVVVKRDEEGGGGRVAGEAAKPSILVVTE